MAEDVERAEQQDAYQSPGQALEVPRFALVVSEVADGDWHVAALVKELAKLDFYVRSLSVPWPFVIARPAKSNRQNDHIIPPELCSPAGTSPTRKLIVNWAWEGIDGEAEQLRFYVKRRGSAWFWPNRSLPVRIAMKEQPPPRRRFVVRVRGNRLDWRGAGSAGKSGA